MLGSGNSFKSVQYHFKDGRIEKVDLATFFDIIVADAGNRLRENPLMLLHSFFMHTQMFESNRRFAQNCKNIRDAIAEVVEDRRKNMDSSKPTDIISICLSDDIYSKDIEAIVDDVIVMFIAGTKTVQGTTTNFIGEYINN